MDKPSDNIIEAARESAMVGHYGAVESNTAAALGARSPGQEFAIHAITTVYPLVREEVRAEAIEEVLKFLRCRGPQPHNCQRCRVAELIEAEFKS